jgi:cyclophilin family peptidyl-prolyl cis-trans isomerase
MSISTALPPPRDLFPSLAILTTLAKRVVLACGAGIVLAGCGGESSTTAVEAPGKAVAPSTPTAPSTPAEPGPLRARVRTSQGEFLIELFADGAPRTVANFCLLARSGFYDGQTWYGMSPVVRQIGRPVPSFTPGYDLPKEFVPNAWFDRAGRVAATVVTDSPESPAHGSGFFVTIKEQPRWNLVYPVFGQVVEGLDVLPMLRNGDTIASVEIEGDPEPLWNRFAPDVARWRGAIEAIGDIPQPVER